MMFLAHAAMITVWYLY